METKYNKTLREKYVQIINQKINNIKTAYILYDAILGQYLLSLTVEIDLAMKVAAIIEYNLGRENE
jgi:uncharacterized protein YlaN (UPF0358 family)